LFAWTKAKEETQKIADLFTSEGKRFGVTFSGSKGFHITEPFQDLLDTKQIKLKDKYTNEDLKKIHQKTNKHILAKVKAQPDVIVGGGEMQLKRVPYSIHPATNLICLPLTRKEFDSFTPDMASLENVCSMNIRNRGVPLW
jgi:DNA primase catalytic subunit